MQPRPKSLETNQPVSALLKWNWIFFISFWFYTRRVWPPCVICENHYYIFDYKTSLLGRGRFRGQMYGANWTRPIRKQQHSVEGWGVAISACLSPYLSLHQSLPSVGLSMSLQQWRFACMSTSRSPRHGEYPTDVCSYIWTRRLERERVIIEFVVSTYHLHNSTHDEATNEPTPSHLPTVSDGPALRCSATRTSHVITYHSWPAHPQR